MTKYRISIVGDLGLQVQAVQLNVRSQLRKGGTALPTNAEVLAQPLVRARLLHVHAQTRN